MLNALLIEDNADAAEKLQFLPGKYCTEKINVIAMRILREQVSQLVNHAQPKSVLPEKIALTTSDGLVFKKIRDVVRCESDRMYTVVVMADGATVSVVRNRKEEFLEQFSKF